MEHCPIRDGKSAGVGVLCQGRGTFIHCDIHSSAKAGVKVSGTADPRVEHWLHCTIHNGKSAGVSVLGQGRGSFTHCDIHRNDKAGANVTGTADSRVELCTIHDGKTVGVTVQCHEVMNRAVAPSPTSTATTYPQQHSGWCRSARHC